MCSLYREIKVQEEAPKKVGLEEAALTSPTFITKDSGERQEFSSGMKRDIQHDKPRFDLLLVSDMPYEAQFLTRWANLMSRGAFKYGERNFEKADSYEELERFMASALRHMMQWLAGETDEDHSAAIAFNLMGAEMVKYRLESTEVFYTAE